MKKLIYPFVALVIMATSAYAVKLAQNWKIKDNYSVKFSSKDPSGIFTGLKGNISFDEANLAGSKFDVTIDAATINTGNGMQNQHAKSEKWFDVKNYPSIKFTSSSIVKTATGYQANGELEMHGVKKPLSIPFTIQKNAGGGIFSGSFSVNRTDYKIGEPGGHAAEILKIDLSVPVGN